MIVVADSSPLISLCRIGKLDLLQQVFGKLLIPDAVWRELTDAQPYKAGVEEISAASWIQRQSIVDLPLVQLLRQDLGAGESEAIVLARECHADVLLMDEQRGRRAAQRLGITCTGLVGVLLEARRLGFVAQPRQVALELREVAGFWISDELVALLQ
jgi:uncharacterized protein